MRYVNNPKMMQWTGPSGPSVPVETMLTRKNPDCLLLYNRIKAELHDQQIPGSQSPRLYYYVTELAGAGSHGVNKLKAGFRITGHTKTTTEIKNGKKSHTNGVLHVENT